MRLSEGQDFRVTCDGSEVTKVDKVRYLGVILDEHLSGQVQVLSVITKVASRLGFFYRCASFLDVNTRIVLYHGT